MSAKQRLKAWVIRRVKAARESELLHGDVRKNYLWWFVAAIADIRQEVENQVDVDPKAQTALTELAELNGVASRVTIMTSIDSKQLEEAVKSRRSLVISDCEGYESDLLLPMSAPSIRQTDFLVECHEMFVPGITTRLEAKLSSTHDVRLITSLPRRAADVPLAASLDSKMVLLSIQERRPTMQWIVAFSKR